MIAFVMENLLIIIGAALIILIGIILGFIFRSRGPKVRIQDGKTDHQVHQDERREYSKEGQESPLVDVQEFGLHLVLDTDQIIDIELPTTIGRSEENTIVIDDDSMSAHHARIYFDDYIGAVCIEDMESLNGIFIDGRPTAKNVLEDGVRLTLGSYSLTFRDTGYLPFPNQQEI